jgi:hypothetical protein
MAEHVDLIRETARLMRAGHAPAASSWPRMADLLDAAAAREDAFLSQPLRAGQVTGLPEVGDEAWLAQQLARAYLGREEDDRGPC